MTIKEIINKKGISVYKLSKESALPYATVNDICSGKAKLEKCSAGTIYKIAQALDVSMESIIAPCFHARSSFENFKSAVCQRLKELGDIDFIMDTLESRDIRTYYYRKWYPECLYLLAMLDYVSRENDVPLDREYDDLRRCRLEKMVYPASLKALAAATESKDVLREAEKTAIPEFLRFNIVENEVRNVI